MIDKNKEVIADKGVEWFNQNNLELSSYEKKYYIKQTYQASPIYSPLIPQFKKS
ncbi:hypothetical protein [Carnobacterium sp.]|uniref:hypothetical protein n=1 Tax=Carnobacterium sp. TaxID=48221 RepID=UPI00388E0810